MPPNRSRDNSYLNDAGSTDFSIDKVLYERHPRHLPRELEAAVSRADFDLQVHVMVLSGGGRTFCAGYDLACYTEGESENTVVREMPWDP